MASRREEEKEGVLLLCGHVPAASFIDLSCIFGVFVGYYRGRENGKKKLFIIVKMRREVMMMMGGEKRRQWSLV